MDSCEDIARTALLAMEPGAVFSDSEIKVIAAPLQVERDRADRAETELRQTQATLEQNCSRLAESERELAEALAQVRRHD